VADVEEMQSKIDREQERPHRAAKAEVSEKPASEDTEMESAT